MKNRVLRSALAVILVIAMVLTMAACNNTDPVETTAPVVTSAPAATTAPAATETPAATVTPTEAPSVDVVDTVEAQLNEYGITFPEFDLEYVDSEDSDYDKDSMAFGLKVDQDNDYQEAYIFDISVKISAVTHDGSSLSSTKYSPDSLGYADKTSATDAYYDAKTISDWITGTDTATDKYYFQVGAAGVYTVTYTIEVEHDKDYEYGYYTPGEVDEKYTITKTYTVEKAELKLKTSDDAFKVEDDMFFVDKTIDGKVTLEDISDYSVKVDVTSCTGTEVGEYPLTLTIVDSKDNAVDASDIVLANYYVTVSEGTRYILSAEDVAKANAVRKMYAADSLAGFTTEYSQETITYYNTLTEGQKVLAAVATYEEDGETVLANFTKYYDDYLVQDLPVSEDDIEEAEYNMNRDYLIDEVEDYIDAYITASTTAKKDAALTDLATLILSIDNTAHEYGSDLLYVLSGLADDEVKFEENIENTITSDGIAGEVILTFLVDEDDDEYNVTFGYYEENDAYGVVNYKYDGYLKDWIDDYNSFLGAKAAIEAAIVSGGALDQDLIDDLTKYATNLEGEYVDLITYQLSLKFDDSDGTVDINDLGSGSKVSSLHSDAIEYEAELVSRWDAYIALIEAYGFEDSYIDNANKDNLAATFQAMAMLLGYDFANASLEATFADDSDFEKTLSNVLFYKYATTEYSSIYQATDDVKYAPDLFVDGVLAAAEQMMQIAIAVQAETDSVKADLINYLVSTGEYEFVNANDAVSASYVATLYGTALLDTFDVDSIDNAATLADIEAYVDYAVLTQALYSDSKFYSNLEKYGLETAMSKLFEDIIEAAQDQIDFLADLADEEITLVGTVDRNGSSPSAIVISGSDYTYTLSGTAANVETSAGDTITVGASQYITGNGSLLSDGDTFVITRNVTFTGAYAALGTVEMQITVTVKNSTVE